MVKIAGRKRMVEIEMLGIGEVIRRLRAESGKIENSLDLEVAKQASFIEEEVKESIAGRRAEHKSVDTGLLANSIEAKKISTANWRVFPKRKKYPKGKLTTQDVAKFMEFGTTRGIVERRHFRNTKARTIKKVQAAINKAVKKAVKKF